MVDDIQQASNTTRPFWVNDGEDAWADPNVPGGDGIDNDSNGYVDDWRGWNFAANNKDVRDGLITPHGTGVASIATARTNNSTAMAGVAGGWGNEVGAKPMIVKFSDINSDPIDDGAAADDAILYAARNGANIINISWALHSNKAAISSAIKRAKKNYNVTFTAASGNDSTTNRAVFFPASHPDVLGTALTNNSDRVQNSHTGPNLDLGAPGISPILNADTNGNLIQISGGTSLASPFVAGAAALMYSINPCISADEAANILKRRADKVNAYDIFNNVNGYKYYDPPNRPGHSDRIGYGRINTNRAVKTAQKHAGSSLDLYIKDHYSDFGYNKSYPDTARFDDWSEIWVRNQPDGRTNREMDEIEYTSSSPAYVYVRVRNKSCTTSTGNDSIGVYWSKASSGTSWPQNWDGSQPNIGDVIAETAIPPLPPGADTILEFPWTISPEPLQSWGTCIMARISSASDPIQPFPGFLAKEIRRNNNIALRNVQVLNIFPGKKYPVVDGQELPHGIQVLSGNVHEGNNDPINLHFDVPRDNENTAITGDAEVRLFLSNDFWQVFAQTDMENHSGIELVSDLELLITEPHAVIRELNFAISERASFFIGFNFLVQEVDSTYRYRYHITQYQSDSIVGSMNFNINRTERNPFAANAGPDQYIYEGQTAQLQAVPIGEPAAYNWYDEGGAFLDTGTTLDVTPEITQPYTLEVLADADLYKDYDEATVYVNPFQILNISPNPAQTSFTVEYDADGAHTASLLLANASNGTTVQTHNVPTIEGQYQISASGLSPGLYMVVLVCNGQIFDSQTIQIQ